MFGLKSKVLVLMIFYQVTVFSSLLVLQASAGTDTGDSFNPTFSSSKARFQNIQGKKLNPMNLTQIVRIIEPPSSREIQKSNSPPSPSSINNSNRRVSFPTFVKGDGSSSPSSHSVTGTTTKVTGENINTVSSSSPVSDSGSNERRDLVRALSNDFNNGNGNGVTRVRIGHNSDNVHGSGPPAMTKYVYNQNYNPEPFPTTSKPSYTHKPIPSGNYYQPYPKPTQGTVITIPVKPTTYIPYYTSPTSPTTTSTPIPTPEPPVVTTQEPIIEIIVHPTSRPPATITTTTTSTSTSRPITTTTMSPVTAPTEGGDIEGEGEDEDDNDSKSVRGSNNNSFRSMRPFAGGVGRSRTTTLDGKTMRTTTKKPLQTFKLTDRGQSSRSMKLNKDESNVVTEFVFSNIKCSRTAQREYFGASIHMKSGFHLPYIRDRPQDPLTSSDCKMERLDAPNAYHINITDLRGCGVEQCGDSYCLTMVFPRVPTLALADDEVTTIKCEPQKSSVSEVRSISFAGDTLENRRSSSTVEGGGQDFAAEVGVFRQNPGTNNGLFVKRVNSGGVVQLGEPLQLRSVVRGGDGWSHSKLTDVKVWRMKDSQPKNYDTLNPMDASEVITLVDARGCRNPEYEVIADAHPLRDPRNNLVHHFTFKAFLFRGQRPNEPLIVTAKVQACQEGGECQPSDCSGTSGRKNGDPNISRFKRSPFDESNSVSRDFSSQLALRVVGLQDDSVSVAEEDFYNNSQQPNRNVSNLAQSCTEKMAFSAVGGGSIVLLLGGLVFSLVFFSFSFRNAKRNQNQNTIDCGSNRHYTNTNGTTRTLPTAAPGKTLNSDFEGSKLNWRKPTADSYHTNAIRKQNKPLPPPPLPMDYPELRFGTKNNNHISSSARSSSTSSSDAQVEQNVAKIIHQLSSDGKKDDSSEYECLDDPREKQGSKKDGVFIVYCLNNDKKWSSTSAPSSLREKKRSRKKTWRYHQEDTGETEESDGSFTNKHHKFSHPRTVRSVKKIQNKKRAGGGIRRRLSSIYREVYSNRCRTGSFPSRIPATSGHGQNRFKDALNRDKDNSDIYSDGFANFTSDRDSAYCGSTRSKLKKQDNRSVRNLEAVFGVSEKKPSYYRDHKKLLKEVLPGRKEEFGPLNDYSTVASLEEESECTPIQQRSGQQTKLNLASSNAPATHFVSRNDSSTQIIILPETDV